MRVCACAGAPPCARAGVCVRSPRLPAAPLSTKEDTTWRCPLLWSQHYTVYASGHCPQKWTYDLTPRRSGRIDRTWRERSRHGQHISACLPACLIACRLQLAPCTILPVAATSVPQCANVMFCLRLRWCRYVPTLRDHADSALSKNNCVYRLLSLTYCLPIGCQHSAHSRSCGTNMAQVFET